MAAIEVVDASVGYGGADVLHSVTVTVERGRWVGLIGPNGAGKTTLLRAVAGLVAHRGDILLDGRPIARMRRRELARSVAMVPQNPIWPADMPVFDYVVMGRTPYISYVGSESVEDLRIARDVLARLDLAALGGRPLGSLSGGELQRAVLARALTQGASVLLLDEPTSALDIGRQGSVLEEVESLREQHGLTVVAAMHDLTLASQFAEELVLLREGCVAAQGAPEAVLTEALIGAHYGASVRVLDHPDGGVVVAPARARRLERSR
jgi:iron complex transport system ATP-binding protein